MAEDNDHVAIQKPSRPTTFDDLFPEIHDVIFDLVRANDFHKRDLFTCPYVSRRWRQRTLKHRFYSVDLTIQAQGTDPSPLVCYLQDFIQTDLFPIVQPFVRQLSLRWANGNYDRIRGDFVQYVGIFPALRHLLLRGNLDRNTGISCVQGAIVPATHRSLDCLGIAGTYAQDPHAFCDILSLFEHILDSRRWVIMLLPLVRLSLFMCVFNDNSWMNVVVIVLTVLFDRLGGATLWWWSKRAREVVGCWPIETVALCVLHNNLCIYHL